MPEDHEGASFDGGVALKDQERSEMETRLGRRARGRDHGGDDDEKRERLTRRKRQLGEAVVGSPLPGSSQLGFDQAEAKTAMPFLEQDRPAKVKEIYAALVRDHPEMPAAMKARIAIRRGRKTKQARKSPKHGGPPYKAPLTSPDAGGAHLAKAAAAFVDELDKLARELSTKAREKLPERVFALPNRRYPIHDRAHARNALARAAQHASPEERAQIESAVRRRFPDIGKEAGWKDYAEAATAGGIAGGIIGGAKGAVEERERKHKARAALKGAWKGLLWGAAGGAAGKGGKALAERLFKHAEMRERLKGGKADGMPDSAFPAAAIRAGMKVEREHIVDPQARKEIAKDHLAEDRRYYAKLKAMEARRGQK